MTVRSVLLGILGAALVCGITYVNDALCHQTYLTSSHMPMAIYGTFFVFVLLINPLLFLAWRRLGLSGRELAVILSLTIVVCCIPGTSLLRGFTCNLVLPFHLERVTPGWQKQEVLSQVPPQMLVQVTPENQATVLDPLISPRTRSAADALPWWHPGAVVRALGAVPWQAWSRPLLFWLPFIFLCWLTLFGLSLVVHRQWSEHEQLPYPIARFVEAVLPQGRETLSAVFRNRLFWAGVVPILLIHLNNYACLWFPNSVLSPMLLTLNFGGMEKVGLLQTIYQGGGSLLFTPTIYATVVAVAFFLASDVSLAIGISAPLWYLINGLLIGYGIRLGGTEPSPTNMMNVGAYTAVLLVCLYIGRRYYLDVLLGALGLRAGAPREAVWGMRIFAASLIGFIVYGSVFGGMEWPLMLVYAGAAVLIQFVLARMMAETGMFYLWTAFAPHTVLLALFGAEALGPKAFLIALMFNAALFLSMRECFMPYLVNTLKLLDLKQVSVPRSATFVPVALVVGLAVAVPVTLYFQYTRGVNNMDSWAVSTTVRRPYDGLVRMQERLQARGQLETARATVGWGHFARINAEPRLVIGFLVGLGLVILFTAGRLRFSKWPIHPVIFLLWQTWPIPYLAPAFLLGWFIKVVVVRYGGAHTYHRAKPLMIGLVVGECAAAAITIAIGMGYYLATGQTPQTFNLFLP